MLKNCLQMLSRTIGNLKRPILLEEQTMISIPKEERNKIIDQMINSRQIKEALLSKF